MSQGADISDANPLAASDTRQRDPQRATSPRAVRAAAVWLTSLAAAFTAPAALAEWALNLPPPKTQTAETIMNLHNGIMLVCFVIFILVSGVMFYSILAHRKNRGAVAAKFTHSTKLEILWTVIPTLILIGFAIPSTQALISMEDTTESELTIKVTGFQWKWQYEYLEHDVAFYSGLLTPRDQIIGAAEKNENYLLDVDNQLVIPTGTKVRFLITATDVIHAWWVPAFGVKKDAIPGYINEAWTLVDEPGIYRGQCAELCGRDHGFMPIVVEVKPKAEFETWLASRASDSSQERVAAQ